MDGSGDAAVTARIRWEWNKFRCGSESLWQGKDELVVSQAEMMCRVFIFHAFVDLKPTQMVW